MSQILHMIVIVIICIWCLLVLFHEMIELIKIQNTCLGCVKEVKYFSDFLFWNSIKLSSYVLRGYKAVFVQVKLVEQILYLLEEIICLRILHVFLYEKQGD